MRHLMTRFIERLGTLEETFGEVLNWNCPGQGGRACGAGKDTEMSRAELVRGAHLTL